MHSLRLSLPLSHHDSVFMSLILLSEALFLPLNQFPPWGLIKLNWNELNMSWSRYEDAKAVWHLFSHIEMKYNVLILNASDRINRNDLRFFPEELSAKPPLHIHTHTYAHTPRDCGVIALVGAVKAGEHTAVSHWFRSVIYVQLSLPLAPGRKRYCLCQHCVSAQNENVITCSVLLLFLQTTNTIWAEDEYFLRRCCHCWWLIWSLPVTWFPFGGVLFVFVGGGPVTRWQEDIQTLKNKSMIPLYNK